MSNIPGNFTDVAITATDDAGHSATVALCTGEISIENLLPDGRVEVVTEAQGHVVGLRKDARALPTFTVTGILAALADAFTMLTQGMTSGFVSTTADIGDGTTVDVTIDISYGAESRIYYCDDVRVTAYGISTGSPSNQRTYSFEVLGPVTDSDGNTWISAR